MSQCPALAGPATTSLILACSVVIARFGRGDQVFGHGQRETPLYIVQSGAVDIIDHAPEGDRYFTQCQERTFIGDLSMFTGEPTLAAGYAAGPTSLIALPPDDVRRVVATAPADLGDLLLRTMVARRDWLMGRGLGQQKLIGSRWSGEAFAVRELLERNLVPFTWHDLATDEEEPRPARRLRHRLRRSVPVLDPLRRRHPPGDRHLDCRRARAAGAGRRTGLRRGRARRRPGRAGLSGLRRLGGPQHPGARALRPGRPGRHERSHRELPRLPHRSHRLRPRPASDPPGAQVRRRDLQRARGLSA